MLDGISRISACVSRVLVDASRMLDGISRVLAGVSRVLVDASRMLDGISRMSAGVSRVLVDASRMLIASFRTLDEFSRIRQVIPVCGARAFCIIMALFRMLVAALRMPASVCRFIVFVCRKRASAFTVLSAVSPFPVNASRMLGAFFCVSAVSSRMLAAAIRMLISLFSCSGADCDKRKPPQRGMSCTAAVVVMP